MAEGRQPQDMDASNMMDCTENTDTSSADLQLSILLPKKLQKKERKMKIKISRHATGAELCDEIEKNLQNIKAENMELTCKGKKLKLDKTLGEQCVKDKGVFQLTEIDNEKRKNQAFFSRIIKGAELLVKRDKDFEGTCFKATGHRREIVKLPESERVVFLTALILHEVGRSYIKKSDYKQALQFLKQAETEFSRCNPELLNGVDNCGVLNLDITWCYLQLKDNQQDDNQQNDKQRDIERHEEARKRLEHAQEYFNTCFGENQNRLQKQKDKSGRHKILSLRLLVLWGVWFFHDNNLPQSRSNFGKAEELLDQLSVDDLSVSTLVNQGYSTKEARLALRAMDGKIEEAKSYIEEMRQEQRAAETRREEHQRLSDADNSEHSSPERDGSPDQINQEPASGANSVPVTGSSLSPPADGSTISAPTVSTAAGAQSDDDEDKILQEIRQYLPNDIDDYIDLSLEDEEAVVREYQTKMSESRQRGS